MVQNHEPRIKLLPGEIKLIKKVLRELLATSAAALSVVPGLVFAIAEPAPLEVAVAARDVVAAAILLDGGAAIRARLRVLQHPLGRFDLIHDALTILAAQLLTPLLVCVSPARRQVGTRRQAMPGKAAFTAEGEGTAAAER